MKITVRADPQADEQIRAASDWWRANRPTAPFLFDEELARLSELLVHTPLMGERYRHRRVPGVRKFLLPATGYYVYYSYHEAAAEVRILAVWSAHRGRRPKLG